MKLKKGDKIKVMVGKDSDREGTIDRVYTGSNSVLILGINQFKKHMKKSEKMPQGGLVEVPRPLNVAKVMLVCPKCNKPTRVGYRLEKDKKVRFCKKCESSI